MALSVSTAFTTLFDAEVKQKYQAQRKLAGLVRERDAQGATTAGVETVPYSTCDGNPYASVALLQDHEIDLVLLDLMLPDISGVGPNVTP